MATLLLTSAVAASGTSGFLGAGLRLAAGIGGSFLDNALFGSTKTRTIEREGPRLKDVHIMSSAEGTPIARLYGRSRVGGQLIWSTRFDEKVSTTTTTSGGGGGGKGGGGGNSAPAVTSTTTTYRYFVSFAVAFAEGEAASLGRVWADGKPLDLSGLTTRFYSGAEAQMPDSFIETIEGSGNVPAYRGLCYLVFEALDIGPFGNRIPQVSAEIVNPLVDGELEGKLGAVALIPGSGEFVYGTEVAVRSSAQGDVSENLHNTAGDTDLLVSLDQLGATAPNCGAVSLVSSWFGSDLRAASCQVRPKVELTAKTVVPRDWAVNGIARAGAQEVSKDALGRPALGGTPSDHTIVAAIAELKARGLEVVFYPFLLMDIPDANGLPDPYGEPEQGAYPWRGRITCHPAPGQPGSPDGTAAAASQLAAFFGTAAIADFSVSGTTVSYTGAPSDWGYRRMVLHYAHLCAAAGGVQGFAIGSELRGLTQTRSAPSTYPAVDALKSLAADVKTILGSGAKITYAADWSEYHSHRPGDGSGDVYFNLDPLWSDANIDAIGIDVYLPLSDWRDGTGHLDFDAGAGTISIYGLDYLKANIEGGEYYDWYYASDADRQSQTRSPITDGAYSKPWVYRNKDIKNWWSNAHYDRPAGVESAAATGWTAMGKPIWFTEIGCPAIDRGSNQPNVFFDPKSSESAAPYFSDGFRDDLIQRRTLEAIIDYWMPAAGNNLTSPVYLAPMIDTARVFAWAWDARPFPDFPLREDVWSDGPNYERGHWLTGRLGQVTLAALVRRLCEDAGLAEVDVEGLYGPNAVVRGYVVDRIMATRAMIDPLMQAYRFDAYESGGDLRFVGGGREPAAALAQDDLALAREGDIAFEITRSQETELPRAIKITYLDERSEYRTATAEGRRLTGGSAGVLDFTVPAVLDQAYARGLAELALHDLWLARETGSAELPPSLLYLDPGDVIELSMDGPAGTANHRLQLTGIDSGLTRKARFKSRGDRGVYTAPRYAGREGRIGEVPVFGPSTVAFMDLPLLTGTEPEPQAPRIAAHQSPWPGSVAIYRGDAMAGFSRIVDVTAPAVIGELTSDLASGPPWRWDQANQPTVLLYSGELSSAAQSVVLGGANALAVEGAAGQWEILQFTTADLIGPGQYRLAKLLRGQRGSEGEMAALAPTGARVVRLDPQALQTLPLSIEQRLRDFTYRYGPGPHTYDHFTYTEATRAFEGRGLRPYAPVHVRAVRDGGGDIQLTWIRRTRIGGDGWDNADVPLSEENERYEIDVMDGAAVKRTLGATTNAATYTAAEEIADFGGAQTSLTLQVFQLSAVFGRGSPKEVTVDV
ncbi:Gene Transfer Agent host specificity protein [hydrothermal vent metagenome]|uniref:Gene Transfer Agent host specificity protein n=1 Tax=hydrothermal vent metagenome TaxID=652676 RepID=A0A3B0THK8_9ZZZZ